MTVESPESLSSLIRETPLDSETKALFEMGFGSVNDTNNHILTMMKEYASHQGNICICVVVASCGL